MNVKELKLLPPIIYNNNYNNTKLLLLKEPNKNFLCSYCKGQDDCPFLMPNNYELMDYDYLYKDQIVTILSDNTDITGVVFLIGEDKLVSNCKRLYKLSKSIYNYNKMLTQYLFTNVEFSDLLKLTPAYKYLTYIDFLMQKRSIDYGLMQTDLDCIFSNATYLDITNSFASGKLIFRNL